MGDLSTSRLVHTYAEYLISSFDRPKLCFYLKRNNRRTPGEQVIKKLSVNQAIIIIINFQVKVNRAV